MVNLASRTAQLRRSDGPGRKYPDDGGLFAAAAAAGEEIAAAYDACDYNRAMRAIMAAGRSGEPICRRARAVEAAKDPARAAELQEVCTVALNLFRQLVVYLSPVLPSLPADRRTVEQADQALGRSADAAGRHESQPF